MKYTFLGILCIVMLAPTCVKSQGGDSTHTVTDLSQKLSAKYVDELGNRSGDLSAKMDKNTDVYLQKLKKQEAQLQQKLSKIDSSAAKRIFNSSEQEYDRIQNELMNNSQNVL